MVISMYWFDAKKKIFMYALYGLVSYFVDILIKLWKSKRFSEYVYEHWPSIHYYLSAFFTVLSFSDDIYSRNAFTQLFFFILFLLCAKGLLLGKKKLLVAQKRLLKSVRRLLLGKRLLVGKKRLLLGKDIVCR